MLGSASGAAEQSRQELVSFMSHDLRTPLAGLQALAEGLEDGVITDVTGHPPHFRSTVARMTVDGRRSVRAIAGPGCA